MPTQTKYTDVKGYATYYYYNGATTLPDVVPDFSRGRKVVMLHGAGSNGHSWHNQVGHLGRAHSPLAIDLPAHGRSAGVDGLMTVQEYSDFVVALLDALGIADQVALAGIAVGSAIALHFAARYPERTSAVVVGSPATGITPDRRAAALERLVQIEAGGMAVAVENAMLNGETIRLDGAIRMQPR